MEMERKNGTTNNAIVTRRKQSIKKRGGLNALWAAVLLQFKSRDSKKGTRAARKDDKEAMTESPDMWKNIVGGIRPLHLQPLESRPSISLPPPPPPPPFDKDVYHDVSPPPSSPEHSFNGMSSRYCSAEDLHALDKSGDDTDGAVEEEGGSDVINSQAEEFIAKFYEQIRLQRLQSLNES